MRSGYVITRDGTSIYYEVDGEGGEPLILIEGLGYANWMWVRQRTLANYVKLIIYDNRGGLDYPQDLINHIPWMIFQMILRIS